MLSVNGVVLGDLFQNRGTQRFPAAQPVPDQFLTNRIHGFDKVHGQLLYAWGRLPFTSGTPVRKIASV